MDHSPAEPLTVPTPHPDTGDRINEMALAQKLLDLSQRLMNVDNEQTFIQIMHGITNVPADNLTLLYIDNDAQGKPESLTVQAGIQLTTGLSRDRYPISQYPIAQLWLSNPISATLIPDIMLEEQFDEGARGLMVRAGQRAMAFVPLFQAGRWIGVLAYLWNTPHSFTADEKAIFDRVTSLITPTVAHYRTIDELENSLVERTSLLDRTQRMFVLSHLLTTVIDKQSLIDIMSGITEIPAAGITLHYIETDADGKAEAMRLVADNLNVESEEVAASFRRYIPLDTLPDSHITALNTQEPAIIRDVAASSVLNASSRDMMLNRGQKSVVAIPLHQAGQPIGVLTYHWSEPCEFSESEQELFHQLPSLLTPVVANLRSKEQLGESLDDRAALLERTQKLLDQTEKLLTVSQMLTTVGDVSTLLTIMHGVTDPQANIVTLNYIDYDEQAEPHLLTVVAGTEPNAEYGMQIPLAMMPGREAWIDHPATARLIPNIAEEPVLDELSRELLAQSQHRAMAVVPLYQANRWVGTITYLWGQPQEFSRIERELFDQLPSLVTPVVANLRAIDERTTLLDRTERLFDVSQKLTTVANVRSFVDIMYSITDEPASFMALHYIDYDEHGQPDLYRLMSGSDPTLDYRSLGMDMHLQTLPAAQMWLSRPTQTTLVSDIETEEQYDEVSRQILLEGGHRATATVPLFQADRWIGAITYLWYTPHEFTSNERELFAQLPALATPVVANLRAIEDLESSLDERAALLSRTERLLTVSQMLTTVTDKQELIYIMYGITEKPAAQMNLSYLDYNAQDELEILRIVAGIDPNPYVPYGKPLPITDMADWQREQIDNPAAIMVGDVNEMPNISDTARQMLEMIDCRALMIIPLVHANRPIGMLNYFWREPVEFSDEELELFSQLASLVTPVVANLRSREQLQESLAELEIASALARESNRLKSEFLATMSHELRTPMNAIEGFTSIMLSGMGGTQFNDASRRYLERINANSKRLLGLINDFLDLSRIESGRLKLVSIPVTPREIALRWRDQVSVLAQSKGLTLNVHVDDNLPETLYGDEENISRIAINLLGNAIKFTEEGTIELRLYPQQDDMWALEVRDSGIGIPPHAREFIFDEFRQVDNSSKRQYGGSGLGLAIVQKLTRAMRGNIVLKSEVGEGSTFTISLPTQLDAEISR